MVPSLGGRWHAQVMQCIPVVLGKVMLEVLVLLALGAVLLLDVAWLRRCAVNGGHAFVLDVIGERRRRRDEVHEVGGFRQRQLVGHELRTEQLCRLLAEPRHQFWRVRCVGEAGGAVIKPRPRDSRQHHAGRSLAQTQGGAVR